MSLPQEKGALSWLTALPMIEFSFTLHKDGFRDALCLLMDGNPQDYLRSVTVDINLQQTMVSHAPCVVFLHCENEIRDITATLFSEVCNKVTIEPHLQPLPGEQLTGASTNIQDAAQLDIAMNGPWGDGMKRLTWTSECSTPLPSQTVRQTSQCLIVSTKTKRKGSMSRGF